MFANSFRKQEVGVFELLEYRARGVANTFGTKFLIFTLHSNGEFVKYYCKLFLLLLLV